MPMFSLLTDRTVPQANRAEPLLPSFSQQRMWFADQVGKRGLEFVCPFAFRIGGELNLDALNAAIGRLVERHESLRTCFVAADGDVFQKIQPASTVELELRNIDAGGDINENIEIELNKFYRTPFDLERGPIFRACLLRVADDDHVLVLVVHHIAIDGWSIEVLLRDLGLFYAAEIRGNLNALTPLDIQFCDFAAWERRSLGEGRFSEDMQYWRDLLAGAPTSLNLPLDFQRPSVQTFRGAWAYFTVTSGIVARIDELARARGATQFHALLGAFYVLLARWSGQYDLIVGTPLANRMLHETEPLVGFFMNLLPLRCQIDECKSFGEIIEQARNLVLDSSDHQGLSFDRLVEEIAPERTLSHNPLVQVTLGLETPPHLVLESCDASVIALHPDVARYDVAFDYWVDPESGELRFEVSYSTDLFEAGTIEDLGARFVQLLENLVADPDRPLVGISCITEGELERVSGWGEGDTLGSEFECIHERFLQTCRESPNAPAVVDSTGSYTYAELESRSQRVARALLERGLQPGDSVGLFLSRSSAFVASLLGVLRAGAAYVPLDPAYPKDRVDYMIVDSGLRYIVTNAILAEHLSSSRVNVLIEDQTERVSESKVIKSRTVCPDDLAYTIYTSGSTGNPKGVQVTHRSLSRLLSALERCGAIRDGAKRVAWNASASFDASVQQWIRVCRGDALYIIDDDLKLEPEEFFTFVTENLISDLDLTPSHAASLIDVMVRKSSQVAEPLQLWIGGEVISESLWHRLAEISMVRPISAINVYGITEATVDSMFASILPGSQSNLGSPLPGSSVLLLDELLRPVPPGVTGEIFIAGPSLASGYLNRPGLTASRFIANPRDQHGTRMYRSGDRARWSREGQLKFLGRTDRQVKIRGYRIELAEVESALQKCSGILDAAVLEVSKPSGAALVSFVQLSQAGTLDAVRAELESRLPAWMRPSQFHSVDRFPRTTNGKIDQASLRSRLESSKANDVDEDKPTTPAECFLAKIWEEVLGRNGVHRTDNFFHLGGHSLLAIRVVARLKRKAQLSIPMTAVFEHPVLSDMAAYLEARFGNGRAEPNTSPDPSKDAMPVEITARAKN